jgi:hypothetical protein
MEARADEAAAADEGRAAAEAWAADEAPAATPNGEASAASPRATDKASATAATESTHATAAEAGHAAATSAHATTTATTAAAHATHALGVGSCDSGRSQEQCSCTRHQNRFHFHCVSSLRDTHEALCFKQKRLAAILRFPITNARSTNRDK